VRFRFSNETQGVIKITLAVQTFWDGANELTCYGDQVSEQIVSFPQHFLGGLFQLFKCILRLLKLILIGNELLILLFDDIIQLLETVLMFAHLVFQLGLQSLPFRQYLLIDNLLNSFPLWLQLLLNLDNLLVSMPNRLARTIFEQGITCASHFDSCQDIRDFTLVHFCLIASYLIKFISQGQVDFNLLGQLVFHPFE